MEREVRVFGDFESADESDRREHTALTPQQRVDLLLELVARYRESLGEAAEGLERVYRVVDLSRG
jgi:hypothetical protein